MCPEFSPCNTTEAVGSSTPQSPPCSECVDRVNAITANIGEAGVIDSLITEIQGGSFCSTLRFTLADHCATLVDQTLHIVLPILSGLSDDWVEGFCQGFGCVQ